MNDLPMKLDVYLCKSIPNCGITQKLVSHFEVLEKSSDPRCFTHCEGKVVFEKPSHKILQESFLRGEFLRIELAFSEEVFHKLCTGHRVSLIDRS